MNTTITSLIRTYVPVAVGAVVAWLLALGVNLDDQTTAGLTAALTGVITAVYYTLVRLLETRYPWVGALLGVPKSPDGYSAGTDADPPASDADPEDPEAFEEGDAADYPDDDDSPEVTETDATPVTDDYEAKH